MTFAIQVITFKKYLNCVQIIIFIYKIFDCGSFCLILNFFRDFLDYNLKIKKRKLRRYSCRYFVCERNKRGSWRSILCPFNLCMKVGSVCDFENACEGGVSLSC